MIRVIGFKQEIRADGRIEDWVHFTASDAMTETGQATHSTWENVKRLIPPDEFEHDAGGLKMAALRSNWTEIEPHYRAWKEGNTIPEGGTPIGAWPALSQQQAEALRAVGMRTVEDVAAATEAILARPPIPNMRDLKKQAALYLEGRSKVALEEEIATLRAQQEAMLEMLAERTEPGAEAEDKPRRGRPRKVEEAAE